MSGEIMSHHAMCTLEGLSLQRGMNFKIRGGHSVLLMSVRPGAPYKDSLSESGAVLHYEGHDAPRNMTAGLDPKTIDQPMRTPLGKLTQNGLFFEAACAARDGQVPERVRVYEKLRDGIWSYNGPFALMDAEIKRDGVRQVFIFHLRAIPEEDQTSPSMLISIRQRIIPTAIKLEVWKRDAGRCVECGAIDELHFDHVLPYAKGGTSMTAKNVQLLCARHNLAKSDSIQ